MEKNNKTYKNSGQSDEGLQGTKYDEAVGQVDEAVGQVDKPV